ARAAVAEQPHVMAGGAVAGLPGDGCGSPVAADGGSEAARGAGGYSPRGAQRAVPEPLRMAQPGADRLSGVAADARRAGRICLDLVLAPASRNCVRALGGSGGSVAAQPCTRLVPSSAAADGPALRSRQYRRRGALSARRQRRASIGAYVDHSADRGGGTARGAGAGGGIRRAATGG